MDSIIGKSSLVTGKKEPRKTLGFNDHSELVVTNAPLVVLSIGWVAFFI
jgi:hypothetical protein